MRHPPTLLRELIVGMRAARARNENAMEYARRATQSEVNTPEATLIAYDLQTGSYVARVQREPAAVDRWTRQLAEIIGQFVRPEGSLLEVGCGEATTLAGVLQQLSARPQHALGFDISWSRCAEGREWLQGQNASAQLFVADLFSIPLEDESVDVVYTSHSIEPNGGREKEALRELLRVTRRALVLFEPIYELAAPEAQARMRHHGYVCNLRETLAALGANVSDYRLLPYVANPLNPTGVIVVEKKAAGHSGAPRFRCPLTHARLADQRDVFFSPETGIAFPVLRGIPLLRAEHGVVASRLGVTPGSTS